ncbi:hypothetical protein BT96DRAFT_1017814 [Gymnopus androsaceus JB14]|uniref:Uncharacterized protein n=1 Tax=Gymnopus androsaceus JB14 TaxID=1447944 RepID=A0A6A4HW61_9AGAR|nr:hypothetical protein BT96DRAFT_1017814 [Gymnopus androsaceus JB14]
MACYEFLQDHKTVSAFRHQCRCLTAVSFSRHHYIMHRRNWDFDELCFFPPKSILSHFGSDYGLFQLDDAKSIAPSESSNHLDLIDLSQEGEGASEVEPAAETNAEKLVRLRKSWTSTVYAFHKGDIKVIVKKGQKHCKFTCAAYGCNHKILQNLETKNRNSTKALLKLMSPAC